MHLPIGVLAILSPAIPLAAAATAQVTVADTPTPLKLIPRGSLASGTNSIERVGQFVHLRFAPSDPTAHALDYVVDLDDPLVATGVIVVSELESMTTPITAGGLCFRTGNGTLGFDNPLVHRNASQTQMTEVHVSDADRSLRIGYTETRGGDQFKKVYTFTIEGKVLRVRATGEKVLDAGSPAGSDPNSFLDNYTCLHVGPIVDAEGSREQHIPYMDNATVVAISGAGLLSEAVASYQLDSYVSSGSDPIVIETSTSPLERFCTIRSGARGLTTGRQLILEPTDETFNLVISDQVSDTFPMSPWARSPYYLTTSGKTSTFSSRIEEDLWTEHKNQYQLLASWGLSDFAFGHHNVRKWGSMLLTPDQDSACLIGCDAGTPFVGTTQTITFPWDATMTPQSVFVVDPDHPTNQGLVDIQYGRMGAAAGSAGALFAHQVAHNTMDPWGVPPYTECGAMGCGYPTGMPLTFKPWVDAGGDWALDVSGITATSGFDPDRHVRQAGGARADDFKMANLFASDKWTWQGYGMRHTLSDPYYLADHLYSQLSTGFTKYGASFAMFDADWQLPTDRKIDKVKDGTTRSHSIAEYIRARARSTEELRNRTGAPLYGEANYWRPKQSYDHGLRDGLRWKLPVDDIYSKAAGVADLYRSHHYWVIPDFNLGEVIRTSAGHAGMGREDKDFMELPAGGRFDGNRGDTRTFMDPYITTIASYGNNGMMALRGHNRIGGSWSYEGIVRQYALTNPVAQRIRQLGSPEVTYVNAAGIEHSLAEAMHDIATATPSLDLKEPRLHVVFDGKMHLYANHTSTPWSVTLDGIGGAGTIDVDVQPDGFCASDGERLLVIFNGSSNQVTNASGATVGNEPIDYVNYVNNWEMLTNRRDNLSGPGTTYDGLHFQGFPSSTVLSSIDQADLDELGEGTIFHNQRDGLVVAVRGAVWDPSISGWTNAQDFANSYSVTGNAPGVGFELIADGTTMATGMGLGIIGSAKYGALGNRDVTRLIAPADKWIVPTGFGARVDQNGVVRATQVGTFQVHMKFGNITDSVTLTSVSGSPVASIDTPSAGLLPGRSYTLSGSNSSAPRGGTLSYEWSFDDGSPNQHGKVIQHVYTTPGSRQVTLKVTDRTEEVASTTLSIDVIGTGGSLYADSFDGGQMDTWSSVVGNWGVVDRKLLVDAPVGGIAELDDSQGGNILASTEFSFAPHAAPTSGRVGLSVRNSAAPGYDCVVEWTGSNYSLSLDNPQGAPQTVSLPNFDPTERHTLMLRAQNSSLVCWLDGLETLSTSGAVTTAGEVQLIADNAITTFDDVRVDKVVTPFVAIDMADSTSSNWGVFLYDTQGAGNIDLNSLQIDLTSVDGSAPGTTVSYSIGQLPPGMALATSTSKSHRYETAIPAVNSLPAGTTRYTIDVNIADVANRTAYERVDFK